MNYEMDVGLHGWGESTPVYQNIHCTTRIISSSRFLHIIKTKKKKITFGTLFHDAVIFQVKTFFFSLSYTFNSVN